MGIVSTANVVGLTLSVLIALLLGAALIFPERF
ncbi:potassium-transporting ATPase [Mycobacterium lacus]|nr:potassium-transporting ATPase [Mycobacterium lacus]